MGQGHPILSKSRKYDVDDFIKPMMIILCEFYRHGTLLRDT
jgi:hypothetical protein